MPIVMDDMMDEVTKLALISEELSVTKRLVPGQTVNVTLRVDTRTQELEVPSATEQVVVETIQIDREIVEIPQIRTEGNVTIIPVVREDAVVVKRLILEQEVRLTKTRTETTRIEAVPIRSQYAVVEKTPPFPPNPTETQS